MTTIHDIEVTAIDGQPRRLSDFKGKVLLVVNVASQCGLTPQYAQLEKLYENRRDAGLEVLGFPCNQFAGQEPGSEEEIATFCESQYGVQFPLFAKVEVNGPGRHPLYKSLIQAKPEAVQNPDSPLRGKLTEMGLLGNDTTAVMWNFEKFLIGRDGKVIGRFAPDITVENPELATAIDKALAS
ncbi:MAG: redoxin domain-containing protein [Gammaproteobacteria bacterium]|nr:redoxin domain-containing protein [Gammaproteobacteria bacterium]